MKIKNISHHKIYHETINSIWYTGIPKNVSWQVRSVVSMNTKCHLKFLFSYYNYLKKEVSEYENKKIIR